MNKLIKIWILISISMYAVELDTTEEAQIVDCRSGNVQSCYAVGVVLTTGKNAENQEKKDLGLEYIRRACKYGHEKACDAMGENYFKDQHYGGAKPYLEKSCERGIVTACNALGTIYRDGNDVHQDDTLSREYYEKACMLRGADACINVAIIYRGGFGVDINRSQEKRYYHKACDAGSAVGCKSFTRMDNKDKGIASEGLWGSVKSLFN
jgi:TPR repeat protein